MGSTSTAKSVLVKVFVSELAVSSDDYVVHFDCDQNEFPDLVHITNELRKCSKVMDGRLNQNEVVFKEKIEKFGGIWAVINDKNSVNDGSIIQCFLYPKILSGSSSSGERDIL